MNKFGLLDLGYKNRLLIESYATHSLLHFKLEIGFVSPKNAEIACKTLRIILESQDLF
jgi:hypothetical protein